MADAAVVGRPAEDVGGIPVYVVVQGGQVVTASEVKAFVADRVAHCTRLGDVNVVDAIPKSASGKILRRLLRDIAAPT